MFLGIDGKFDIFLFSDQLNQSLGIFFIVFKVIEMLYFLLPLEQMWTQKLFVGVSIHHYDDLSFWETWKCEKGP